MINVLLVCPKFPPSFWSFETAIKLLGLEATMPPTGLATIAAMLPARFFRVLPIVDLNVEPLTDKHLAAADLVMFTAMIVQQGSLRQLIARAKRLGKTVVVGGPYATTYVDEVLAMGADHVVAGEAEMTLRFFVEDFLAGKAKRVYDEASVRDRVQVALTREGKPVITETPIPRWDLLKLRAYSSMAVQFSRGCPFNCEFCDIVVLNGHEPRTKTPAQFIAELEAIWQTGWRGSVFVVDDNFIGDKRAARELLLELYQWQKKHRFPFSFFTEVSLNLANERELCELMIAAGFGEIFVGIESIDPESLNGYHKVQNKGDIGRQVEILQAAGFEVMAGLIIGGDNDKPTVFDDLFHFLQEKGVVIPMAGLLTALRGTPLYQRLVGEGSLRRETIGLNTDQLGFNFQPKLDEKTLISGYVRFLDRLFSPRNYYERCRILRDRRGWYRRISRINRPSLLAAARIIYRNLFRHPDWEFAKFILGTIWKAPRELAEAITQAVKLAHFREMTEATIRTYCQTWLGSAPA
jgi:radical SAM superfamily enzyme YgiQ (UPF0313 family)